MGVYLDFAKAHWILSLAFIIVTALLLGNEILIKMRGLAKIGAQALVALVNKEQAQVLDLRPSSEFKNGHIAGAEHLDQADLQVKLPKLISDKAKPIILVCAQGQKSLAAAQAVQKLGYQRVYYLAQGMLGWRQENLPVVK